MRLRCVTTLAILLLAAVFGAACAKKNSPTAPQAPDNPNAPNIGYVEHINVDTPWVDLSPSDEDVVIAMPPRFDVRNPGPVWQEGYLQFSDGGSVPRTVRKQTTVVAVSRSSWQVASPERHLWVTLKRPGQTSQFEEQLY